MPADQRLSRNDLRQIEKSNRIVKLLRRGLFAIIGLVVLVEGAMLLADVQDHYLFASLAKALGVFNSGNTCNIAIGAKLLFWLQLAVELGIVALAFSMKPTATELEQARRAWDFQSMRRVPKRPGMLLLILAFAALCYLLSYLLGYSQTARYQPCSTQTIRRALDYLAILIIYAARGTAVVTVCALYFDHKVTQGSRAGGPLT